MKYVVLIPFTVVIEKCLSSSLSLYMNTSDSVHKTHCFIPLFLIILLYFIISFAMNKLSCVL